MENGNQNLATQTPKDVAQKARRHDGGLSATDFVRPRAHILETGNGFTLQVELPGVSKGGVEVTVENGELTIVGHRVPFETDMELVYRESRPADFRRVFEIDSTIDTAHISADLDQGVLTLTLPKAEAARPRRIEIHGAN